VLFNTAPEIIITRTDNLVYKNLFRILTKYNLDLMSSIFTHEKITQYLANNVSKYGQDVFTKSVGISDIKDLVDWFNKSMYISCGNLEG